MSSDITIYSVIALFENDMMIPNEYDSLLVDMLNVTVEFDLIDHISKWQVAVSYLVKVKGHGKKLVWNKNLETRRRSMA